MTRCRRASADALIPRGFDFQLWGPVITVGLLGAVDAVLLICAVLP